MSAQGPQGQGSPRDWPNSLPHPERQRRLYGKYRANVLDNVDPQFLGRILAEVPSLPGSSLNWAMPCVPYAGPGVGFYAIPPIAANVWIEFEEGDPNKPIWAGCFWAPLEVPMVLGPPLPEIKVFKTDWITMILNDLPGLGGFTLECSPPAVLDFLKMVFNAEGISIVCPEATISMTPGSVTITVPEAMVSITPAAIEITVPPSTFTMTSAATELESPEVSVTAEAGIEIEGGGDVSIIAGGAAELSAGADVSVAGGGAANLTAGGDVAITGGGAAELTGGGDVAVTGGGAAELTGADVAITGAAIEITAAAIAMTGAVEVTGDLLIDGQQPLFV